MSESIFECVGLGRVYGSGRSAISVLRDASLTINRGELVALVAPSGAGKSTLLHLAGLLERPDSGILRIGGVDCSDLSDSRRTFLRRTEIGFVYQFHHLLPELTAVENISIPQRVAGLSRRDATTRAMELLATMNLTDRATHRPSELSGGEQQRVAIARAVANRPRLLLADEPTGNLDPSTSGLVFESLTSLVRSTGLAALIATHNHSLASKMDRVITIRDGAIIPN